MKARTKIILALSLLIGAMLVVFRKPLIRTYRSWGYEMSSGRFQDPEGLAIDSEGNLYVADEDWMKISVLDPRGRTLRQFHFVDGYEVNGKRVPTSWGGSMAVIAPGHILAVAYEAVVELEVLGEKPKLIRLMGKGRGTGPGEFHGIEGLARDPETGEFWVSDENNRRIQVFDAEGAFVRMFSVPAEPEGLCLYRDSVYVTFSKANWVGQFSRKTGELQLRFGASGSGPGQFQVPDFVCVSPDERLYVTDQENDRIQVFELDGTHRSTIGGSGSGPGELRSPEEIVFNRQGNLVVTDAGNSRLQILTPDGKSVRILK